MLDSAYPLVQLLQVGIQVLNCKEFSEEHIFLLKILKARVKIELAT